jgi:glycosyltransferase involved in cell wall biosynthesis/nucleotide-binding universal stress UspA family protein
MNIGNRLNQRETLQSIHYTATNPYRVLMPINNLTEAEFLFTLAEAIVRERDGHLLILYDIHAPEDEPRCKSAAIASVGREALSTLLSQKAGMTAQIKTRVRVASPAWDSIWETVAEEQINLVLCALPSPSLPDTLVEKMEEVRQYEPPCDVVTVFPAAGRNISDVWSSVKQILIPVRGGPGSTLALRIGHALAQHINADLSLLHVTHPAAGKEDLRFVEEFSSALHGLERVTRFLTAKGDLSQSILKEVGGHQVIIMGTPIGGGISSSHIPWLEATLSHGTITLILVKDGKIPNIFDDKPKKRLLQKIDRPVAVVVDKWFAENTYHSHEFEDLNNLIKLKQEQNITISLGLPALNEEATVGQIIRSLKKALMEEAPLVDEMVLIDSGSADRTRQIAADLGIPVYIHHEILPQYGAYNGKGEALWKSLFVLKGDIIAWIDTDIKNIHPRFIYGILGPLLCAPRVQYVKGFYQRPLKQGNKLVAGGGGRVTELTARPLINLYFPELSGVIQPLSGEYAGRRSAFERIPFFTGYGVETGLLIDLFNKFGLGAIAQVDLLERIHRNRGLASLSKMSFAIIQVVHNRLEHRHKSRLLNEANLTMNKIIYGTRNYYLEPEEICERERPPMISIPEYIQVAVNRKQMDSIYRETVKTISPEQTGAYPVRYSFKSSYPGVRPPESHL